METARKLLVLDLDETLIYATRQPLDRVPDFLVPPYSVYKRLYLAEFLTYCLGNFDVAVWTSASPDYAAEIVREIFPAEANLIFVWASDRCSRGYDPERYEHYSRKPFLKLWRRHRQYGRGGILAIDDTPQKWEQSYGNHIAVREWIGDEADDELRFLIPYLETLREHPNVRTIEKRGWRTGVENAVPRPGS